jgi:hypothetical protein
LAIAVARSERRPHRNEFGEKQYFKRIGDSSIAMEHYEIEDSLGDLRVPFCGQSFNTWSEAILHPRAQTDHRPCRHQRKDKPKARGLRLRFGFASICELRRSRLLRRSGGGVRGRNLFEGILPDRNLPLIVFIDEVKHFVAVVAKGAVTSDPGVGLPIQSRSRGRSRPRGGSDPRWQERLDQIDGGVLLRFRFFGP